jgi:two-component system sensor histidine kinase HydH
MRTPRLRPTGYITLFILLLAILLLAIILASLGQRSLKREKSLLLDLKRRQATLMVRSISSAARISTMMLESGDRHLIRFVNDAAESEEVVFVALYDNSGRFLTGSHRFIPDVHGLSLREFNNRLAGVDESYALEELPELGRMFLFVSRFNPLDSSWIHLRMLEIPSIPGVTEESEETEHGYYVLIGMDTTDLDEAVEESTKQLLLNGFMLLLLGTIGFYFLIVLQGYFTARKALADVQQYTVDVIDGMAEGLVSIDNEGIIRTVNPEAERMLDVKLKEIAGKHWSDFFSEDRWENMSVLLARGTPFYDQEMLAPDKDGSHLAATMIPVRSQVGGGGSVLFLRDTGEVKLLEAEVRRSERLAALGRLVAGMAHEIRNPLNSIRGFSQHLSQRFEEDSQEGRSISIIMKEVDRLNRVITELLDFSRPREPVLEELDLNEVVRSAASLVERESISQGVKVVEELRPEGLFINGDEDSLKQLLINLFLNAFQALAEGGVLTITTSLGKDHAELEVSDTGTGIADEDLDSIFEPFFTRKAEGTGLGLAIVHRIVQDHGGEIRVSSTPGRGTTVVVKFPKV